jgi:Ca2+-binding RTX toxin-like protein
MADITISATSPVIAGRDYRCIDYALYARTRSTISNPNSDYDPYCDCWYLNPLLDAVDGSPWFDGFAPPPPPGEAPRIYCGHRYASIIGTAGDDLLSGTAGRDTITGLGGKDTISGLGGNDTICGGSGKDTLKGGPGNDTLSSGKGKNTLKGGSGWDNCTGRASGCETWGLL